MGEWEKWGEKERWGQGIERHKWGRLERGKESLWDQCAPTEGLSMRRWAEWSGSLLEGSENMEQRKVPGGLRATGRERRFGYWRE